MLMAPSIVLEIWLWAAKISLVLILASLLTTRSRTPKRASDGRCIQIVVLGDIGRSPRMQYHAISFADAGLKVYLVGYTLSKLHSGILSRSTIKVVPLRPFPQLLTTRSRALFLIAGPLKVLFQLWSILEALYQRSPKSEWMLVQNPPAIPTLAICILVSRLRQSRLVIDWHNLGFSILALKLGSAHLLVKISRLYEDLLSRFAYAHICVTQAMVRYLRQEFHINERVFTLCDRPAPLFQPLGQSERHEFLKKLSFSLAQPDAFGNLESIKILRQAKHSPRTPSTTLPQQVFNEVQTGLRRLVVSPTSWTPDENFKLLLDALVAYNGACQSKSEMNLPALLVIITGKGPDRESFESEVQRLFDDDQLSRIEIMTAFFDDLEDYAKLLGSADLGISLHTSSSGIDLPMKVLDMFGAALPVAGWSDFEAWSELVTEAKNGLGFNDAAGLCKILEDVFGKDTKVLRDLRRGATDEGKIRWDDEWTPVCQKLFEIP